MKNASRANISENSSVTAHPMAAAAQRDAWRHDPYPGRAEDAGPYVGPITALRRQQALTGQSTGGASATDEWRAQSSHDSNATSRTLAEEGVDPSKFESGATAALTREAPSPTASKHAETPSFDSEGFKIFGTPLNAADAVDRAGAEDAIALAPPAVCGQEALREEEARARRKHRRRHKKGEKVWDSFVDLSLCPRRDRFRSPAPEDADPVSDNPQGN